MKRLVYLIIPLLLTYQAQAQVNLHGKHLRTNYSWETYKASPQNWDITQDKRGVLYFANNDDGILEYDGQSWRKIPIVNNQIVRSLGSTAEGTVYAGGVGDFGVLRPDKRGHLHYHSLSADLPGDKTFQDVWKTYTIGDTVFFCTKKYIFQFNNDTLVRSESLPANSFLSFLIDQTLYIGNYAQGLLVFNNDSIEQAPGGDFFAGKDVFVMLPYQNDLLLISTSEHGLFLYNKKTGKVLSADNVSPSLARTNAFLQDAFAYNALRLSSGDYAVATLQNGLVIIDKETGGISHHYHDKNGLQDATVINLFESRHNNLWLGLNNGIARIDLGQPLKYLGTREGLQGIVLDIIHFRSRFYVGTTAGVFQRHLGPDGEPYFEQLGSIKNQARSFARLPGSGGQSDRLLVGTLSGIYDLTDSSNIRQVDPEKFYKTYRLLASDYHPGRVFVGHSAGITAFDYANGQYTEVPLPDTLVDLTEFMVETDPQTLWVAQNLNGLYKITHWETVESADTALGLPQKEALRLFELNGQPLVAARTGLYRYQPDRDRFEAWQLAGTAFELAKTQYAHEFHNQLWAVLKNQSNGEFLQRITQWDTPNPQIRKAPFRRIEQATLQVVYEGDWPYIWIGTSEGIYSYNNNQGQVADQPFHTLIREVSLNYDSVLFYGTNFSDTLNRALAFTQPECLTPHLRYINNDIEFRFAATFFENPEETKFSYKLQGYDKEWSNWSRKADKGYTNLDEGTYVFEVKARNIYGVESEIASYRFTVEPPFYRTLLAYFVYLVAIVGLIVFIVKWYTRRLKREKIRLENIVQQRTREVVEQKDEIARKNVEITDSIQYASRIQNAVLPEEDRMSSVLSDYFVFFRPRDIVSGDFYWVGQKDGYVVIIAADCTGHGVPGAFMSMLGIAMLNEIINKQPITQASIILNELRDKVKSTLKQTGKDNETKDGMDIALAVLDTNTLKMQFAGAYNPLYLVRKGELLKYKADRMPIGIHIREKESFTNHSIQLQKGDAFYLFSDGYQDQFGGEKGGKFKSGNLQKLLLRMADLPMQEQRKILTETFDQWQGSYPQVDDVIVIGVRV